MNVHVPGCKILDSEQLFQRLVEEEAEYPGAAKPPRTRIPPTNHLYQMEGMDRTTALVHVGENDVAHAWEVADIIPMWSQMVLWKLADYAIHPFAADVLSIAYKHGLPFDLPKHYSVLPHESGIEQGQQLIWQYGHAKPLISQLRETSDRLKGSPPCWFEVYCHYRCRWVKEVSEYGYWFKVYCHYRRRWVAAERIQRAWARYTYSRRWVAAERIQRAWARYTYSPWGPGAHASVKRLKRAAATDVKDAQV
jgi:hypothetical protein